jgi:hypothetical protein
MTQGTAVRMNLNNDGPSVPTVSHTHTHPSHSQTSRLLSTSLSLGMCDGWVCDLESMDDPSIFKLMRKAAVANPTLLFIMNR